MTVAMSDDLRVFAVQKWPTMNHKWRKAKLASMLRMSERRVKSIYEADPAARVRADEAVRIKTLLQQGQAEDAALTTRIAELETHVARLMAVLDREALEAARAQADFEVGAPADRRGLHSGRRSTDRTSTEIEG